MPAASYDLPIEQGATFRRTFTWERREGTAPPVPIDLTDATARMQIRSAVGRPVLQELTTENGGITLGGVAGTIALHVSDDDTDALSVARGIYDLEVAFPSGDVIRVLQGKVTVSANVTRDVVP